MSTDVAGVCPACGSRSLFLAEGGHVTCRIADCQNPCAVDELLDDTEIHHIVQFGDLGFAIRHPLIERVDDALMHCSLHLHLEMLDGPPVKPGRYRAQKTGTRWAFTEVTDRP